MKFTYSWLKEHLQTSASVDDISTKLTSLGLEVDSVVNPADELNDFIIAEITSAAPHPDADKLKVCQVFTGTETLQIVCGGKNARENIKVVLAPVGSTMPVNGLKIKASKIRGIESFGMLCAAEELGLESHSEGIMELDLNAPVGESYALYAGLNDPVFDLEITPNRGDCLGVRGIARDLSATGIGQLIPLENPEFTTHGACPIAVNLDFDEDSKKACPYFTGRVIRGVKNGPSPEWLQKKLRSIGLKPISALVDITNYMTFTYNRPMHVFDTKKLNGNALTLRLSEQGETLLALDEKEYTLANGMTVITDDSQIVSLAGIMGGENSGCDETTTDVFLESAYFDPVATALTGRKLGIHSDSRFRFERGVDPDIVLSGLDIATKMILDLCGGQASEPVIAGSEPVSKQTVYFDPKTVKSRGAVTVSREKIESILTTLGFRIEDQNCNYIVSVPSWRHDIDCAEGLVEEVCRVVGYDHIEEEDLPHGCSDEFFESHKGSLQNNNRRYKLRRLLASRGLCECNTWSFLDKKRAEFFEGGDPALILKNPLSKEFEVMRPSLLVNLIIGAGRNKDRGIENSALFEIGAVFDPQFTNLQEMRVGGIRTDHHAPRHWLNKERFVDMYDIKADILAVLQTCDVNTDSISIKPEAPSYFHPGRSGTIYLGPKTPLGVFGEIHPKILQDMDVNAHVMGFEVFLDRLPLVKQTHKKKLLKLSSLQPIHRDFAFLVDQDAPSDNIVKAARRVNRNLITDAHVFDIYEGKGIPEGKKSVALTVTFEPHERTMTDDEINGIMDEIIVAVGSQAGGELRS